MKLKEFEGKELFTKSGISTSKGILIRSLDELNQIDFNTSTFIAKVQTLQGGRGKKRGVRIVSNRQDAEAFVNEFLGKEFHGELVQEILLDEKIEILKELYLGLLFDTKKRVPIFIFSEQGGVDIEELQLNSPNKIIVEEINILKGLTKENCEELLSKSSFTEEVNFKLQKVMKNLWKCFTQFDCKMLEVNPLVITKDNSLIAIDSVVVLDDDANYRREIKFSKRMDDRKKTPREIAANKIDENDPKGVAGKTFIDLDGDIGILTSGGGASMTLMDALLEYGGKAANFTEYSGDPSREKVQQLTRIVLSKENLSGLLVAGVIANFTNIKETLTGVADVLIELKPDYPIVIRRAGPHDTEAKIMLAEIKDNYGLDIHYFDEKTPMTKSAEIIVELSKKYKQKKGVTQ
ncbi:hypothetical protein CL619_02355 [archaeon]|nr:hypothetical protein [archaeon]